MHRPALADYPPGAQLAERVLDDYEFVWMVRGHATVTAAEPIDLRPGQLLLVPAGSGTASSGTVGARRSTATSTSPPTTFAAACRASQG